MLFFFLYIYSVKYCIGPYKSLVDIFAQGENFRVWSEATKFLVDIFAQGENFSCLVRSIL